MILLPLPLFFAWPLTWVLVCPCNNCPQCCQIGCKFLSRCLIFYQPFNPTARLYLPDLRIHQLPHPAHFFLAVPLDHLRHSIFVIPDLIEEIIPNLGNTSLAKIGRSARIELSRLVQAQHANSRTHHNGLLSWRKLRENLLEISKISPLSHLGSDQQCHSLIRGG